MALLDGDNFNYYSYTMFYKVSNISLKHIYERYKIKTMSVLSDDDLSTICEELHCLPVLKKIKINNASRSVIDKQRTVATIVKHNTFSFYVPLEFIDEKKRLELQQSGFYEIINSVSRGPETYEAFSQEGIGAILRPGENAEVEMPRKYLEEVFKKHPFFTLGKLEVVNIETDEAVTPIEVVKEENDELNLKAYGEIKDIAKSLGIEKPHGKTRVALIEEIRELKKNLPTKKDGGQV